MPSNVIDVPVDPEKFERLFHRDVTVHGPREGDRHIFPGTTLGNLPRARDTFLEFVGKMSSPRPVNGYIGTIGTRRDNLLWS